MNLVKKSVKFHSKKSAKNRIVNMWITQILSVRIKVINILKTDKFRI